MSIFLQNCFVPALFCILSHQEISMREVAVKLLSEVAALKPQDPKKSIHILLTHLVQLRDEITQHEE
jgi:hypothetical protein